LGSCGAGSADGKEQFRVDFAAFCLVHPVHKACSQPPSAPSSWQSVYQASEKGAPSQRTRALV
jgi:hypothetical protein